MKLFVVNFVLKICYVLYNMASPDLCKVITCYDLMMLWYKMVKGSAQGVDIEVRRGLL